MKKEIVDIFTKALRPLKKYTTVSDWALGEELSGKRRREFRRGFKINDEEEILYCRDTSFWDDGNQGTVFTDKNLHICFVNNVSESLFHLPWSILVKAEYKDDAIIFSYESGRKTLPLRYFVKGGSCHERSRWGEIISDAINQVVEYLNNEKERRLENNQIIFDEFDAKFRELCDEDKNEEAAELAYKSYAEYGISGMLTYGIAIDPNSERSLSLINKEWDSWKDDEYTSCILKVLYASQLLLSGNVRKARKHALKTYNELPEELEWVTGNQKEFVKNVFEEANSAYVDSFFDISYQERKLLMPVHGYSDLEQRYITVLHLDDLQQIKFPSGHPIANNLYVAHPLLQSYYVPFEIYEIEFIKDKVHEFCHLMQCLGATSISIEYHQALEIDSESDRDIFLSANASVKLYSAKGSVHEYKKNRFMERIGQELNLEQKFNPSKAPFVPDNLVWYPQETSWQRLVQQRLQGSLTSHIENIVTSKTQVINNESLSEIKAELKVLLADAKLEISEKMSEQLKQHESVVLNIHVEFAPIDQLDNTSSEGK
jgi:hypothetical protein